MRPSHSTLVQRARRGRFRIAMAGVRVPHLTRGMGSNRPPRFGRLRTGRSSIGSTTGVLCIGSPCPTMGPCCSPAMAPQQGRARTGLPCCASLTGRSLPVATCQWGARHTSARTINTSFCHTNPGLVANPSVCWTARPWTSFGSHRLRMPTRWWHFVRTRLKLEPWEPTVVGYLVPAWPKSGTPHPAPSIWRRQQISMDRGGSIFSATAGQLQALACMNPSGNPNDNRLTVT